MSNISITGLVAAQQHLQTISANVANANTDGFKGQNAKFASLVGVAEGPGLGVRTSDTMTNFSQGSLRSTGQALDLALSGRGFFVTLPSSSATTGSSGTVSGSVLDTTARLTRNGAFKMDKEGYIVDLAGRKLAVRGTLGGNPESHGYFGVTSNTISSTTVTGASTVVTSVADASTWADYTNDYQLKFSVSGGNTTYEVRDKGTNELLTSGTYVAGSAIKFQGAEVTVSGTAPANNDEYTISRRVAITSSRVTDPALWSGRGDDYTIEFAVAAGPPVAYTYGIKTSTGGNLDPAISGVTYTPPTGSNTTTISFQGAELTLRGTPANGDKIQILQSSRVAAARVDLNGGSGSGVSRVEVRQGGEVFAIYGNKSSVSIGKVAIANVQDASNLVAENNGNYSFITQAEMPLVSTSEASGRGSVVSGMLEGSNVDLTSELVSMITAQRNYQANARGLSAADQLTQTIINLR